eukprot:CAMPEP_0168215846 /NCGR_PEP_ID=MMETSP0140_2-20121125/6226_1 /TAXON_ID=44445 /ORGANISM="Pseudo-nitzschia australis, Strain 10249 10 AB" /LENGTH=129 /DNA_ID=CAMNT_0008143151 /DNA_START=115 /DNA_END=504 /DNA_ORIENTATION=+
MTQATRSSKRRSPRPPRTARASPSTWPTPLTVSSNDAYVAFPAIAQTKTTPKVKPSLGITNLTAETVAAPLSKTDPTPASTPARPTPPANLQIQFHDHLVYDAYSKKKKKSKKKNTSRPAPAASLPRRG